jgi:RNA polymerase sigma factor (TIGR02999 family)
MRIPSPPFPEERDIFAAFRMPTHICTSMVQSHARIAVCGGSSMPEATEIYARLREGDRVASNRMFELVYDELRRLAHQHLRGEANRQSLQTTMLVHEAYLRLVGDDQDWEGKPHFFGAAAEAMRRILVDRARARQALKRGPEWKQINLDMPIVDASSPPDEVLLVNDAFDQLAVKYPEEADVAKLRYFAGMKLSEVAHALDISTSSAHRRWKFARAWLIRAMTDEPDKDT